MLHRNALLLLFTFVLNEDREEPDPSECNSARAGFTNATMSCYPPNMSTNIPYQSLLETLITNASIQSDYTLFIIVAIFKVVLKSLQA